MSLDPRVATPALLALARRVANAAAAAVPPEYTNIRSRVGEAARRAVVDALDAPPAEGEHVHVPGWSARDSAHRCEGRLPPDAEGRRARCPVVFVALPVPPDAPASTTGPQEYLDAADSGEVPGHGEEPQP